MRFDDLNKRMAERHANGGATATSTYASYDEVPVYRKRWFFVLMVLFVTPVGIILALSGDIYMLRDGSVMEYGKQQR